MNLVTNENYHWWAEPADESIGDSDYVDQCRANSLLEHMRSLEENHKEVHRQNLFNYQLYSNRFLSSFDWGTGILTAASLAPVSQTTDNVILEVVDATLSEIGKARPKAKPICHGASWKTRQMARKLDKFLYGEFVRNKVYEVGKELLLNSEVCTFGAAEVTIEEDAKGNSRTCVKSVFPDDLLIDQQEVVATKKIWHIIHRQVLPAHVVAATYNIDLQEARDAAESMTTYLSYRPKDPEYVVVGTAYRISAEGLPGRKVIAIKDRLLLDEPWDHEWLPYVFFHWQRPMQGFYTQSLVEQILPDQIRLNEINEVIEEAQNIMCGPRLLAQQGSQINPQALDNIIGKVVYYTGAEPKAVTWPAVAKELYEERDRRKSNAFTKVGLNQQAASGNVQGRLDSSPAIRELNQVQDNRLADPTQRYELMFMELAHTMVRVIKASGKSPTTVWYSGGRRTRAEKIDWSKIDLDEDSYTMILEPASSFSMTPSAIRDDLEAQLARGEITPDRYRQQLQAPDPDNETSILAAAAEHTDFLMEECEEGRPVNIDPNVDLVNALQRLTLGYNLLSRYEDVPVEVYECFLDAIEQIKMWSQKAMEMPPENEMAPPVAMPMPAQPVPGGPLG